MIWNVMNECSKKIERREKKIIFRYQQLHKKENKAFAYAQMIILASIYTIYELKLLLICVNKLVTKTNS